MLKKSTFCLLLLCCLAAFSPFLHAQDAEKLENRFLFIIDTSASMNGLSEAGRKAVQKLLKSGIEGQLREGDTIGVWTYNDTLHNEFPMQIWSEPSKQTISNTILAFLNSQKCEKTSRLDRVLPSMLAVVQASQTLTVILISDGSGTIKGTPFDDDINKLHSEYGKDLRAANLPFITILASRNGTIFDYTINSSISQIRVPQTAEPVKKTAPAPLPITTQPPPTPAASKPVEIKRIEIGNPNPPKPVPIIVAAPVLPPTPEIKPVPAVTPPAAPELVTANPPPTNPAITPANTTEVQKVESVPAKKAPVAEAEPLETKTVPSAAASTTSTIVVSDRPILEQDHTTRLLLVVACFLLATLTATIGLLVFRLRRTTHTSLISQSMSAHKGNDSSKH